MIHKNDLCKWKLILLNPWIMPRVGTPSGRVEGQRISWVVVVVILTAITSSSLSALSLYHMLALKAEVEGLKSEIRNRREESRDTPEDGVRGPQLQQQKREDEGNQTLQGGSEELETDATERQHVQSGLKKRSLGSESEQLGLHPCLQMIADSKKEVFQKEFEMETHIAIPWQTGLKQGEALEEDQDAILVKEEGYYFIYSQVAHNDPPVTKVYYKDPNYAMGHIVIRLKQNVVGDESHHVILLRCIQTMNVKVPYNTCFTGGVAKLEVGDRVELLIPRTSAKVFLDGECTFMGAIKLS